MSNILQLVPRNKKNISDVNDEFHNCIDKIEEMDIKAFMITYITSDGDVECEGSWDNDFTSYALLGAIDVMKTRIINDDFFEDE